jgi:hypothetical protein
MLIAARIRGTTEPLAWQTICCGRIPQEKEISFVEPPKVTFGGTFADVTALSADDFFVRVWVSTQPIPDERVRPTMVDEANPNLGPIRRAVSAGKNHALHFEPLGAGTNYWYAIQFIDRFGDGELISGAFTTKQRKVDITIGNLTVVDDGDNSGTGEAEFVVAIWKNQTVINFQKFGDDDSPKEIDDNPATQFDVGMHETIGPEPGDFTIGINAHGREFDTFSDELASTSGNEINLWDPWQLQFQTGPAENFTFKDEIAVPSVNDETFAFKVAVDCIVSYV